MILKMDEGIELIFRQRRDRDGQQVYENILTSLIIRETQIKTAKKYHLICWDGCYQKKRKKIIRFF